MKRSIFEAGCPLAVKDQQNHCLSPRAGLLKVFRENRLDKIFGHPATAAVAHNNPVFMGQGKRANQIIQRRAYGFFHRIIFCRSGNKPSKRLRMRPWSLPSGFWGVHKLPKAGHSNGFLSPCRINPEMQISDSLVLISATSKRSFRIKIMHILFSASNRSWGSRRYPRQLRSQGSRCLVIIFCAAVFPHGSQREDTHYELQRYSLSSIFTVSRMPQAKIERFKTGHCHRRLILSGDRFIFLITHDRTNMAGGQKTLNPIGR